MYAMSSSEMLPLDSQLRFLASEESAFVTGQGVNVSGGWML